MNIYRMLGNRLGTPQALELGERLAAWHDAMVAHERVARNCDDECPHIEAGMLWTRAVETFGDEAHELRFLRARGGAGQVHA
jgi:hypothetical protein